MSEASFIKINYNKNTELFEICLFTVLLTSRVSHSSKHHRASWNNIFSKLTNLLFLSIGKEYKWNFSRIKTLFSMFPSFLYTFFTLPAVALGLTVKGH